MNLWDEKAKFFPRYEDEKSDQMKHFFAFFERLGLDFKGKSLVDAGGGTGRWGMQFAKLCSRVTIFDGSTKMIEKLNEDKEKYKFSNVTSLLSSLMDFKEKGFDFAFMSRCPALDCDEAIRHFMSLGKTRIVITFSKAGENSFQDFVLNKLGFGLRVDYFKPDILEEYLKAQNIPYQKESSDDEYEIKRDLDEALATATWFLQMKGLDFDEAKLKVIIPKEGVVEEVRSFIKCLVF